MGLPDPAELNPEERKAALRTVVAALWARGELRYKYHRTQVEMNDIVDARLATSPERSFFLLCSRRLGKSFWLVSRAFSLAIQRKHARILYLAPWAKDAADIANDLAIQLLEDCPAHFRPEYNAQAREYHFNNGSIVRLKGVNGEHARYLRGGAADLIILDEAGLMDELDAVINDVCLPMTATTDGAILIATTPPVTPGHASATKYEKLARQGAAVKYTLLDAPHIPRHAKARLLIEVGEDPSRVEGILDGELEAETTTALREFFCEFVTDESSAVLPEFRRVKKQVVQEVARPDYYDRYVAMDPGMKDRTGIIFGYWDFENTRLVIEDELLLNAPNTLTIAQRIADKERELWQLVPPYQRVSDVDLRLIADLHQLHGLRFVAAQKEDSLGAVNLMRTMLVKDQIRIHPRCKNLIRQCENAIWNARGSDFARPEAANQSIDGHYDLTAAMKYLCRSVNRGRNPFPEHYYRMGGKFGPPAGSWVSPRARRKPRVNLYGDTPLGRRLSSAAVRPAGTARRELA